MIEEITSSETEKVKTILELEHGVSFLPKREFNIPPLIPQHIGNIVGRQNVDSATNQLLMLVGYLKGTPVADQFEINHEERRKWRRERRKEFGDTFRVLCEKHNQFRINVIGVTNLAIMGLERFAERNKHKKIARHLRTILDDLYIKLKGINPQTAQKVGKDYNVMSLAEKLEVVHFYEDKCLEVLQLFSPTPKTD